MNEKREPAVAPLSLRRAAEKIFVRTHGYKPRVESANEQKYLRYIEGVIARTVARPAEVWGVEMLIESNQWRLLGHVLYKSEREAEWLAKQGGASKRVVPLCRTSETVAPPEEVRMQVREKVDAPLSAFHLEKRENCAHCHRTGWVCEQHPAKGWLVGEDFDCSGPGMPCPSCNPMSPYVAQLEARLGVLGAVGTGQRCGWPKLSSIPELQEVLIDAGCFGFTYGVPSRWGPEILAHIRRRVQRIEAHE